jgi:5-methylcytosine-specific restriction enzyme A
LVPKGMCDKHKKETAQGYDRYRGTHTKRGYDGSWSALRLRILKRDQYLCQHCLHRDNRMVPAEHVDHIKPFTSNGDPLRLDPSNLQALCQPCHSRKTALEDGGFGRAKKQI